MRGDKKYINKPDAEVHFLVGGTQNNSIVITPYT